MRRLARLCVLVGVGVLALPGHASAAVESLVFDSAPITVTSYEVARRLQLAPSPKVDGYVVGMSADVVDPEGNPVSPMDVMLHHVVFAKVGVPDYTCSNVADYSGRPAPFQAQRFYAEGEERFSLSLPEGYGYPNRGQDAWGLLYMLMNHHPHTMVVQIRYTVRYVTGTQLAAVKPVWLDIENCRADPVFNVPGAGPQGSTFTRTWDFRMPESGRFVAGGGHLHGGGVSLDVTDMRCGSLFTSYPTWGLIQPFPILHEPGPLHMTGFADPVGRPVSAGDVVRLTTRYDDSRPHVRVMGIVILYFVPGATSGCESFTSPLPPYTQPERVTIQLLKPPAGTIRRDLRGTWVGDYTFGAQRVSLRRGTVFTWRFRGSVEHDVTLASGPVGFASPSMSRGSFSFHFTRRGTYRLFCSLHPARMTQIITVR